MSFWRGISEEKQRLARTAMERLSLKEAPDSIWAAIEAGLDEQPVPHRSESPVPRWRLAVAMAASLILISTAAYWLVKVRPQDAGWAVDRLEGQPSINAEPMPAAARIRAGELLETGAAARARIQVGEIGTVDVAPNTRIRLIAARPGEHRIALDRGEIRAAISAPPRLFFVETRSATAVDLGCAYTLQTDESGDGLLRVTQGWVLLDSGKLDSLVPAGANCRLRNPGGPGTPYFSDASAAFTDAVEAFDAGNSRAVNSVLAQARVRDTLTLWHLLPRVTPGERAPIIDRMIALTPLPEGVSRGKALQLDPATLEHWLNELAWTW